MRNRIISVLYTTLLLGACSAGVDDRELGRYLFPLETLRKTDLEQSAVSAFQAVSGKKHRGDKVLYQALQDCVLPRYSEFFTRLHNIRPRDTALSNIHFVYTEGARYQLLAFSNISEYLVNQEAESLRRYNEQSRHAASLIGQWRRGLDGMIHRAKK